MQIFYLEPSAKRRGTTQSISWMVRCPLSLSEDSDSRGSEKTDPERVRRDWPSTHSSTYSHSAKQDTVTLRHPHIPTLAPHLKRLVLLSTSSHHWRVYGGYRLFGRAMRVCERNIQYRGGAEHSRVAVFDIVHIDTA